MGAQSSPSTARITNSGPKAYSRLSGSTISWRNWPNPPRWIWTASPLRKPCTTRADHSQPQPPHAGLTPGASLPQHGKQLREVAPSHQDRVGQPRARGPCPPVGVDALQQIFLLRERRERHPRLEQLLNRMEKGHDLDVTAEKQNLAVTIEQTSVRGSDAAGRLGVHVARNQRSGVRSPDGHGVRGVHAAN